MSAAFDDLLRLLDIETLDLNLFRGQSRDDGFRQLFGGQVIAQGLAAACRTVPVDRAPQSLHAYFLRPGDASLPVIYEVERIRDGGSFTTRRVQAIQRSVPILSMMLSFHVEEDGWEHQVATPAVPAPESLSAGSALYQDWLDGPRDQSPGMLRIQEIAERAGIEFRPVLARESAAGITPGAQTLWFRGTGLPPADRQLHPCLLAFASDFCLIGTAKLPHGGHFGQQDMMMASLDHAIWFHRPADLSDWLLYDMESSTAAAGRAYTSGRIHDRSGRLVATVTQEGLMRRRRPAST